MAARRLARAANERQTQLQRRFELELEAGVATLGGDEAQESVQLVDGGNEWILVQGNEWLWTLPSVTTDVELEQLDQLHHPGLPLAMTGPANRLGRETQVVLLLCLYFILHRRFGATRRRRQPTVLEGAGAGDEKRR